MIGVVAIIGFFGSMCLFPTINVARPAARRTACLSNMKQVTRALLLYASDYDERLPPLHAGRTRLPFLITGGISGASPWLWTCPEDRNPVDQFDGTPGDRSVSYGYNGLSLAPSGRGIRLTSVKKPAATVAFVDSDSDFATPATLGGNPPMYRHENRINIAWLDGHIRTERAGILEETAVSEEGALLEPGIDSYRWWNRK